MDASPADRTDRSLLLESLARPSPRPSDATPARTRRALALGLREPGWVAWLPALAAWFVLALVVLARPSIAFGLAVFAATVLLSVGTLWSVWTVADANRRVEETAGSWAAAQPFRVVGYERYLDAAEPSLTVRMERPIDGKLCGAAIRSLHRNVVVDVIDARTVRVTLPPRTLGASRIEYADVALLHALFDDLLVPLHAEHPIALVTLADRGHATAEAGRSKQAP